MNTIGNRVIRPSISPLTVSSSKIALIEQIPKIIVR